MENRVLVPVDGTESKEELLAYLQAIGPSEDTEVTLLHVLPGPRGTELPPLEPPDMLDRLRDPLGAEGWRVNTELRMGDPVEEITKLAIMLPASLVVMSTHGRAGLERIREGSVTESVLKRSPCPLFILHSTRPEPPDRRSSGLFRRILVPLDDSDESAAILGCVERFSKTHGAEVILFHDEMGHGTDDESLSVPQMRLKMEEISVKLANTGIKVTLDWTTAKRPIREILRTIDEMKVDLVAMVTHGQDQKCRVLEESVTAEVIRHANCPLMVWSVEPRCDV